MKSPTLLETLEIIASPANDLFNLLIAFVKAGYGASYNKIMREYEDLSCVSPEEEKLMVFAKKRMQSKIYLYKKEGLITKMGEDENIKIVLTTKGVNRLKLERIKSKLNIKIGKINRENNQIIISEKTPERTMLITFDIPEKIRWKRDWTRDALSFIGLKMIQKSVWFGKTKMLNEFIHDIKLIELNKYIKIFYVNKLGEIKRIDQK